MTSWVRGAVKEPVDVGLGPGGLDAGEDIGRAAAGRRVASLGTGGSGDREPHTEGCERVLRIHHSRWCGR